MGFKLQFYLKYRWGSLKQLSFALRKSEKDSPHISNSCEMHDQICNDNITMLYGVKKTLSLSKCVFTGIQKMKVLEIAAGASQALISSMGNTLSAFSIYFILFLSTSLFYKSYLSVWWDFPSRSWPQWISNDFNSTQTGALASK